MTGGLKQEPPIWIIVLGMLSSSDIPLTSPAGGANFGIWRSYVPERAGVTSDWLGSV